MKRSIFIITSLAALMFGCKEERIDYIDSKGLSLYWNHQIFNEQGRGYIFEFCEAERSEFEYKLVFEYQIDNTQKNINISLVDKINKGKCPYYPSPDKDGSLCAACGSFYIPEDMVNEGNYKFTVKTLNYTVQSEIIFCKEKATLNIPDNNYLSCAIEDVFITPKNLLYGSIIFSGEQYNTFALDFIEDIRSLGLRDTIVMNPPFNLNIDETGKPVITSWPPNNYSVPFLFTMTSDFSTIFELAKVHFNKSAINIYLFSSNGDQARLDDEGVNVWYAE